MGHFSTAGVRFWAAMLGIALYVVVLRNLQFLFSADPPIRLGWGIGPSNNDSDNS